jgi:hypothetical protein
MFRFVTSLFGCAHAHCAFPRTATKPGYPSSTYVVCLDCGKESSYDWAQMKRVTTAKQVRQHLHHLQYRDRENLEDHKCHCLRYSATVRPNPSG